MNEREGEKQTASMNRNSTLVGVSELALSTFFSSRSYHRRVSKGRDTISKPIVANSRNLTKQQVASESEKMNRLDFTLGND